MAIARLCWKLFHEENHYSAVEKHRRKLEWIVKRVDVMEPDVEGLPDDMDFISVLAGQLAFTKQYGKLGDASTVYKFVHDATDDKDLILLNNQKDAIRESISRLDELLGEAGLKKAQNADIEVAISAAFKNARKRLHTFIAKQYLLTLSQSPSRSNDKRQDVPFGIDGAVALVRKLWALDYHEEEGFSGPINTAMDQIAQHLDEIFEADENDRIRFSLEHLDNAFLIGRKFNKFIGILGFTNRGKSLLLRSIAFNAAMQGKKVLFVGLEGGDALNTKTQFGLLLGSIYEMQKTCPLPNHENCTFKMPSYENFKHKRITQEDKDHMALVLRQLDNHEVLPVSSKSVTAKPLTIGIPSRSLLSVRSTTWLASTTWTFSTRPGSRARIANSPSKPCTNKRATYVVSSDALSSPLSKSTVLVKLRRRGRTHTKNASMI